MEQHSDKAKISDNPVTTLKIASLNIKNVKSNRIYIQQLLQNFNIICIQEHWLFQFQLPHLNDLSSEHTFHGKSVDMNDPISPLQIPRGYGGSAVLYRKDWKTNTIKRPDGSERMMVLEMETIPPTCVVSVYACHAEGTLPNFNLRPPLQSYKTSLQVWYYKHNVENTIERFKPTNEAQFRLLVDNLPETLKDAETSSIPQKKTCSKKKKKKCTWSPEIKEAYMKSKDAHRKWKHSGRPSYASHPLTRSLK